MIAEPKAMSQGSKGAGGGALTALSGRSAARAEPVTAEPATIATAVANNTTFFMTIPIAFKGQSDSDAPQGQAIIDCNSNSFHGGNLERGTRRGKQKTQASADFLGVTAVWCNVGCGCCIPTTI